MTRDAEITRFLARHGYGAAQVAPLAQDASFRRYLRLTGGPRPAVLMDAPPPEDVRPFLRVAAHLAGIGVSVPDIIGADEAAGLVLEEDLGDALFPVLLAVAASPSPLSPPPSPPSPPPSWPGLTRPSALRPWCADGRVKPGHDGEEGAGHDGEGGAPATALFDAAIDVLVAIHRAAPPRDLPLWDATLMRETALGTLLDWWWPAMFGAAPPDAARTDFAAALADLLAPVAAGPHSFVHRDYFAGNLLWLPDRAGLRRVGVIDFQSAALGHPAYDLVSLLQDARRVIPAGIEHRAIARYLRARPDLDPDAFRAAYAACAAQRHLRVAGQWVRLARRDNRPAYLAYGPHTWALLNDALRHPAAAPLATAMDRWIPQTHRANPPDLAA
jgi:aminoglycoside/choline kinase family phosphotransferase